MRELRCVLALVVAKRTALSRTHRRFTQKSLTRIPNKHTQALERVQKCWLVVNFAVILSQFL